MSMACVCASVCVLALVWNSFFIISNVYARVWMYVWFLFYITFEEVLQPRRMCVLAYSCVLGDFIPLVCTCACKRVGRNVVNYVLFFLFASFRLSLCMQFILTPLSCRRYLTEYGTDNNNNGTRVHTSALFFWSPSHKLTLFSLSHSSEQKY